MLCFRNEYSIYSILFFTYTTTGRKCLGNLHVINTGKVNYNRKDMVIISGLIIRKQVRKLSFPGGISEQLK